MADSAVPSNGTPHDVLAALGDLTRRVRAAQRGTWFPLLLLGLLVLGGIAVNRLTQSVRAVPCGPDAPGPGGDCTLVSQGSPAYWLIGFALVYTATAAFYLHRARRRGVGTTVRPYVLTGAALLLLVGATEFWSTRHGMPGPGEPVDLWGISLAQGSVAADLLARLTGTAVTIGIPLLVLCRVERSRALLLFTALYLAVELTRPDTSWAGIPATSPWASLPRLALPGLLLLLAALGFGLAERRRGRDTA
ncbi:hypothetical protein [Kitasatospora sp. NPDC004289]